MKNQELVKTGDLVLIWIPKSRREKTSNRWEGPFVVERVLSEVRVVINGKEEHVYNLKKFVRKETVGAGETAEILTGDEEVNEQVEEELPRPKRKAAVQAYENLKSKRARVANISVVPRGMLLWIE